MRAKHVLVLAALTPSGFPQAVDAADWEWVVDARASLPALILDGATVSAATVDETIYLVSDGRLYRCEKLPDTTGTCAFARDVTRQIPEGGEVTSIEGTAIVTGYRGLPPADLLRNQDKKRKRWDLMIPLVEAASREISPSGPATIDFAAPVSRVLAIKIDAYGAAGQNLAVRIVSRAGGDPIYAGEMAIETGGRASLSERIDIPDDFGSEGQVTLERVASPEQEADSGSDEPLSAETWIMSIAVPEDDR